MRGERREIKRSALSYQQTPSERRECRTHNGLIFGWLQALCFRMICHHLTCNWVISTMVSILNILVGKVIFDRFFMSDAASLSVIAAKQHVFVISPERALASPVTLSFYEERADVWAVTLVIRVCPGQLLQHFFPGRCRPRPNLHQGLITIFHLSMTTSEGQRPIIGTNVPCSPCSAHSTPG